MPKIIRLSGMRLPYNEFYDIYDAFPSVTALTDKKKSYICRTNGQRIT